MLSIILLIYFFLRLDYVSRQLSYLALDSDISGIHNINLGILTNVLEKIPSDKSENQYNILEPKLLDDDLKEYIDKFKKSLVILKRLKEILN